MDASRARQSPSFYSRRGKRAIDLVFGALGLTVLSPVMLVVAALVRARLGSPVLFRQTRPGLNERPFGLLKFRTMTDARDASGQLLPDTRRLTEFGAFLRKTSLDELPELWNVVRGEMSLVGPRPLLMRYTAYFTPAERVRFTVRPGITGLAQVSGRNDLDWDSRIAADVRYVSQMSLTLDLKILLTTAQRVLRRSGLQVDPGGVMLDFDEERRQRLAGTGANGE
jgi:lipopolysaccharide/colanic/teichoic acid biosynthesis glycosyltransferase